MNQQEQFWAGDFGDSYTLRNDFDYRIRIPFFKNILDDLDVKEILEIGCNSGKNLEAIKETNKKLQLYGIDINNTALKVAEAKGFDVHELPATDVLDFFDSIEMVMTVGCLIHIPPSNIEAIMRDIACVAIKYILCIEYESDREEEVNYRGHNERLWRRPYGKIYEALGLKLLKTGRLTKEEGFDDCTFWLFSQ